jgi:hypothetical protein
VWVECTDRRDHFDWPPTLVVTSLMPCATQRDKYMKLIEGKDRTYACEVVQGQDCSSNRMARKIAIPDK